MPVGRGIPIRNPIGARIAILTAAFASIGSAMVEYIIGGRKRKYNIPSPAIPPIINTKFFILFFAILALRRLPAPLDISRVNNNNAKVIVGLPIKRMSFCRSASSIKIKPMPKVPAKISLQFQRWHRVALLLPLAVASQTTRNTGYHPLLGTPLFRTYYKTGQG